MGGDALALAGDVGLPFDYHEERLTGLTPSAEHLAGRHLEVFGYPRQSRSAKSPRTVVENSAIRSSRSPLWFGTRTHAVTCAL